MTPFPLSPIVVFLSMLAVVPALAARPDLTVEDFSASDPAKVRHGGDTSVTQAVCRATTNALDGSRAVSFSARLEGPNAGWAGCGLPIADGQIPAGADTLEFDARAEGESRWMFVTLDERDGSRWNINVPVGREWRHYAVPVHRFEWFMGPDTRKETRPVFGQAKEISPWVSNTFQGQNGFALDNVRLVDAVPEVRIEANAPATVAAQHPFQVTLRAKDRHTGTPAPFGGTIWMDVEDRNAANYPQQVEIRDGQVSVEVFPRRVGPLTLRFWEPVSATETSMTVNAEARSIQTGFFFDGFEGEQVMMTGTPLTPNLRMSGPGPIPKSVHIEIRDQQGRVVFARNESAAELAANAQNSEQRIAHPTPRPTPARSRRAMERPADDRTMRLFAPGLMTAEVKLLAEPLAALPRATGHAPEYISLDPAAPVTTASRVVQPDGVTTASVYGNLVRLESLPTTATVLGHDQFTLWNLSRTAREALLYGSPFAICSGGLFHLSEEDIATTGARRLKWHRRLGSFWGRNDLWWNEIEPFLGVFKLSKVDKVVQAYRSEYLRLLGILCYASAWSPGGAAPATADERANWRGFVSNMARRYGMKIIAYEVWNEPNFGFWRPNGNVLDYRELVKATYEEVRKVSPGPRIVAGATARYDPVFLDRMLADGYKQFLDVVSFHPYPERHWQGPEENSFSDICDAARSLMRKHDILAKELWITETGWATHPGGCTEAEQARWLVQMYTVALAGGVHKVFWFNLHDWRRAPWEGQFDSHLGLLDSNYRPKPSAIAYNLMQFQLTRTEFVKTTQQGAATIYSFRILPQSSKVDGMMHVAWTSRPGETAEVALAESKPGGMAAADCLGAERTPVNRDELAHQPSLPGSLRTFRYRVGADPVFIWDVGGPIRELTEAEVRGTTQTDGSENP